MIPRLFPSTFANSKSVPFPSNSPTLRQSVTEKSGSHTPPPHLWAWVVPEHPAGAARERHLNLFWWVVDLKGVWCLLWLPVLVLVHCAHTINAGMALHYLVYTCSLPWTLVDLYPTAPGCAVQPGRCCGLCCEGLRVCHVPLNIPRRAEGPDGPVDHCPRGALGGTATNPLQSRPGNRICPHCHGLTQIHTEEDSNRWVLIGFACRDAASRFDADWNHFATGVDPKNPGSQDPNSPR